MKRLFLVLATSVALSAWGQAGLENSKAPSVASSDSGQTRTVMIPGPDGRPHEFQVQTAGAADLEGVAGSQAGCPVQIAHVSFDRPAELMLTSRGRRDSAPSLRLDYRNVSGKEIESVVLTGWIKVKESLYQLDSVTHSFQLHLTLTGKDGEATQALKLASNAIGFDRVELSLVNYRDGTNWRPKARNCVYANFGATERAGAQ